MRLASRLAATVTYHDVANLIWKTALQFHHAHGGDVDDLVSEGHEVFCNVFRYYDCDASPFAGWLRFKLWKAFLSKARQITISQRRMPVMGADAEFFELVPAHELPEFDAADFLRTLSEDAKLVARLALDPCKDVRINATIRKGLHDPKSHRAAIKEYLRSTGWDRERIERSFLEVHRAL